MSVANQSRSPQNPAMSHNRGQGGMSLIEVVVFIVVLGIAFAGILALFNRLTTASVDPMVRKQALAIASSLLEEIELHAFTYCDPDDTNVYTATGSPGGGCTVDEVIGPEAGETRYADPRFDNVNDYDQFAMGLGAIRTIDSPTPIPGLEGYSVLVTVPPVVPPADALKITVAVSHPQTGVAVSLQGYRLRYAPISP